MTWFDDQKFGIDVKNSEFAHFGILPGICIHSLVEDQYSKMYIPREKCKCGSTEWIESTMDIVKPVIGYEFPKKDIHRCNECNEVRMADHIGAIEEGNRK